MRFLELTLAKSNRTFLVNAGCIISIEDCNDLGRAVRTTESAREDENPDWIVSETLEQIKQMLDMARDNTGPMAVITQREAESHRPHF